MESTKGLFYDWMGMNVWLFKLINSISGQTYDLAMLYISKLGDIAILPFFMMGLAIFIFVSLSLRKLQKKGGTPHYAAMWFGVILVLIIGFIINRMSIEYLKDYFGYARPYVALAKESVRHLEADKGLPYGYQSFPSGHVSQICVLVFALWPALSGSLRWLGLVLIVAVGWSRMALGVHFPVDVLAAIFIAAIEIFLVRNILYALLLRFFRVKC